MKKITVRRFLLPIISPSHLSTETERSRYSRTSASTRSGATAGNYLYGAITAELGVPLSVALGFGDAAEFLDDILDRVMPGGQPDEGISCDTQAAKDQVRAGARCPG